ncbi:hypothetical protein C2I36_14680 [Rhodobacteraceae bacterium WD3A24]|nr:hypothetical protein C2I36_14680 [Rhodobacteraceae bacterium WD3A24]
MPLLSCITTTFEDGALLRTSIRSLQAQGFDDFEMIVVDDGADSATRAVIEEIHDPRLRGIRQANAGLSSARNTGLAQARGDYVCFLDADDSRPPWAFETIAGIIARDDPDLILCRGALGELRGAPQPFYDTPRFEEIAAHCPEGVLGPDTPDAAFLRALALMLEPQSANKVVRRTLVTGAGLRFPDTHFFEDIFFHAGAVTTAGRIAFAQTPCFAYFRRYGRPQITAGSGARRFDIVAVTRMTLETFARTPAFADPLQRAAVFCACMKLLTWCGEMIGHADRPHFHQLTRAMVRLVDPLYLQFPDTAFETLSVPDPVRIRVRELAHAC